MSDEVFRIVVTAAVGLVCIAFMLQAGIAIALARVARRKVSPLMERAASVIGKLGPLIDEGGAILEKAGPVIDKVGQTMDKFGVVLDNTAQIIKETRPRISEFSTEAIGIAKSWRQQVEKVGDLLHDASDCARARLAQIGQTVDRTIEQFEHGGNAMKRALMRPVHQVNGIIAGVYAAVSAVAGRSENLSGDHAIRKKRT